VLLAVAEKHLVQKSLCLLYLGRDIKLEIKVLQIVHLTVAAW